MSLTAYSQHLFKYLQAGYQNIEEKLRELELGLNKHKYEVGEIKKQINSIEQNERQTWRDQDNGAKDDIRAEPLQKPERVAKPSISGQSDADLSKCTFRVDIDPKPDIQVN